MMKNHGNALIGGIASTAAKFSTLDCIVSTSGL